MAHRVGFRLVGGMGALRGRTPARRPYSLLEINQLRGAVAGHNGLRGFTVIDKNTGIQFKEIDGLGRFLDGSPCIKLERESRFAYGLLHEKIAEVGYYRSRESIDAVSAFNQELRAERQATRDVTIIDIRLNSADREIRTLHREMQEYRTHFSPFERYKETLKEAQSRFNRTEEEIERLKDELVGLGRLVGKRIAAYGEDDPKNIELIEAYNYLYYTLFETKELYKEVKAEYKRKIVTWTEWSKSKAWDAAKNPLTRRVISTVVGALTECLVVGGAWPAVIGAIGVAGASAVAYKYSNQANKYSNQAKAGIGVVGGVAMIAGAAVSGVRGLTGAAVGFVSDMVVNKAVEHFQERDRIDIFDFGNDHAIAHGCWTRRDAHRLAVEDESAHVARALREIGQEEDPQAEINRLTQLSDNIKKAIGTLHGPWYKSGKDLSIREKVKLQREINRVLIRAIDARREPLNGGRLFTTRDMNLQTLTWLKDRPIPFYIENFAHKSANRDVMEDELGAILQDIEKELGGPAIRRRRTTSTDYLSEDESPIAREKDNDMSVFLRFTRNKIFRKAMFETLATKVTKPWWRGDWKFKELSDDERLFVRGLHSFYHRVGLQAFEAQMSLYIDDTALERIQKENLLATLKNGYTLTHA